MCFGLINIKEANRKTGYNSIVFKSIPSNYYNAVPGPTDLDVHDIATLSRLPLQYPFKVANYTWNDFVSNLEQGNYKTLSTDEPYAWHSPTRILRRESNL